MKKIFLKLFVLLLSMIILTSCTTPIVADNSTLIENRIEKFIAAYNSGDYDEVIDCFSKKTRNAYKSATNIGESIGGMFGIDIKASDLFGLGVGFMSDGDMLTVKDINIEIEDDSHAVAESAIMYQDVTTEGGEQALIFSMVKEGGNWYIDDIN